jgi:hypothetical protein
VKFLGYIAILFVIFVFGILVFGFLKESSVGVKVIGKNAESHGAITIAESLRHQMVVEVWSYTARFGPERRYIRLVRASSSSELPFFWEWRTQAREFTFDEARTCFTASNRGAIDGGLCEEATTIVGSDPKIRARVSEIIHRVLRERE